ncbi:MAG: EAL domain-containing protein [Betaproteobacteria bacterium]|nr:EAL domain-containing protein [Betaproteobacteria bacterium]
MSERNTDDGQQVFLGRQPILGSDRQLAAYELLFRSGQIASGNHADVLDATQATATVIANAFTELSVGDALGPYRGFINVDIDFLFSELIEVLPQQSVVLEILENIPPTPEVLARCRQLCDLGFTLAVDDVIQASAGYRPLLALADIIKVDVKELDNQALRALVALLKPLGKKLLAEKVETGEQMAFCQSLGFELFQGYFFAKPTVIAGKKLNPAQLTLMRLLGLLMEDAESADLEKAFKLEPGLTVNLMRLTNSVGSGVTTQITSLRHAIAVLGRRQLQRWLQLLLYTNPKDGAQSFNPLLQLAATRGRLMELLADRVHANNREFADHAFMVGIMSLMPTLLGVAMEEILAQLPVAQRVKQALTDFGGPLGDLLQLVEATELTDLLATEEALQRLPALKAQTVSACIAQALAWANNLGRENV